jgi:uncharacterized membrane protein YqiK
MSETQIVKAETQELDQELSSLRGQLASIVVNDAPTCLSAKQGQRTVRDYMKKVHSRLDPFVLLAKQNLDGAKAELNRYIDPAELIDTSLAQKVKDYERREREAAEAETRRINEERRIEAARKAEEERQERNRIAAIEQKERERIAEIERKEREAELKRQREAGEINKREQEKQQKIAREKADAERKAAQEAAERERERAAKDAVIAASNVAEVTVAPSIPKMAGVPSRRNYGARIIDASRVPEQWWVIDERALKAEAQKVKKTGELIPGVEFYEE